MKRYLSLAVVALALLQASAYAETIKGTITGMDATRNILNVQRTDNKEAALLNVRVKEDTKTKNVASLKDLKIGHQVKIDAKEDKQSGVFEAKSIEVTSRANAVAEPAATTASTNPNATANADMKAAAPKGASPATDAHATDASSETANSNNTTSNY